MAICEFCRNDGATNVACAHCGRVLSRYEECQIVCGTDSKTEIVRLSVTDKYMMIHRKSGGETGIAATFGLVGVIAAAALSKGTLYGYYDHAEIAKVIYPYHNKKYKKDNALKIVNKNGSDLIIKAVVGGITMEKVAACFRLAGVVIDGSGADYGNVFCAKPFVNKKTMGSRICPSAVSFVKPVKGNFYAESVSDQPVAAVPVQEAAPVSPAPQPTPVAHQPKVEQPAPVAKEELTPAPAPAPVQEKAEPVATEPVVPVVEQQPVKEEPPQVVYTPPVVKERVEEPSAPAPVEVPKVEPQPATPPTSVYTPPVKKDFGLFKTQKHKFCTGCGQKLDMEDKFCDRCGKAQ